MKSSRINALNYQHSNNDYMKYLTSIYARTKACFIAIVTARFSFNSIENLQDGSGRIAMSQISFKNFIYRINKKQYELWIELPNGGSLWIYHLLKFRYEKPSYLHF